MGEAGSFEKNAMVLFVVIGALLFVIFLLALYIILKIRKRSEAEFQSDKMKQEIINDELKGTDIEMTSVNIVVNATPITQTCEGMDDSSDSSLGLFGGNTTNQTIKNQSGKDSDDDDDMYENEQNHENVPTTTTK